METFNRIAELLDEKDRTEKTQRLMLEGGMAFRSDAGMNFFAGRVDAQLSIMRRLDAYPWEWVQAVKIVLELRKRTDIKGRVPIL